MDQVGGLLLVGAVAMTVTLVLTPISRLIAFRIGAVARTSERKVHSVTTPSLGGLAMLAGVGAGLLTAWVSGSFEAVFRSSTDIAGIVLAVLIIFAVGLADDIREVSAPAKVAGIVLAGVVLAFGGVSLLWMRLPFAGLVQLSADLSVVLTVIWLLVIANAVNLIDGLDGLAGGIVAIAAGSFFVYAVQLGSDGVILSSNPGALLSIITAGVCLGFLPFNMHPAKTFMGDSGALLLGFMLAASTISVGGRIDQAVSGQVFFFFAPLVIPLLLLGVPLADLSLAVMRRVSRKGVSISEADKEHLHHRLMRLGHGHRRTVLILWLWTALLCGLVLYSTLTGSGDGILPFAGGALALVLYTVFHPITESPPSAAAPHDV
ncbi:MAG: undecaprenyl/decaprenyl-phosphate alpha-N-acetylglucosaminyl 1-phosphate transferase [Acidimicrobiales bacterium]|nr:undecaprenyl/decaprenyl-phosphate alpha-N-acetylglucosaminyl 1-phosphate transferase [Acidimicrobiales bacterium]RZV47841.1 MAG: undecaprenyl/decaprenyl-phosphate alpha-N-acetylglucosaminyl 1-phosphate transferase [Acidimicrobiales bacterium]